MSPGLKGTFPGFHLNPTLFHSSLPNIIYGQEFLQNFQMLFFLLILANVICGLQKENITPYPTIAALF